MKWLSVFFVAGCNLVMQGNEILLAVNNFFSPSVSDQVDHKAAIKEYSRSSADQEEPLPHELRPLPVLSMTMDYLVTQIMDLGHDNYRDWYDFVWNRTRGIRKVVLQMSCSSYT